MSIVPQPRLERIQFYENHLNAWGTNAAAIGLTATEVGDLATLVISARGSYNAAEMVRTQSKTATQGYHDDVRSMHGGPGAGSDLIKKIQNFASSTDDPNVYVLAEIPPPQPASSIPAPGAPTDLRVELLAGGSLRLSWKSVNPPGASGTVYEVRRSTDNGASYENIGISGAREFTDDTLISGSFQVQYLITGLRSTKRGDSGHFVVQFGMGGGGVSIIRSSTVSSDDIKLAA